jgi:hypothetical protein
MTDTVLVRSHEQIKTLKYIKSKTTVWKEWAANLPWRPRNMLEFCQHSFAMGIQTTNSEGRTQQRSYSLLTVKGGIVENGWLWHEPPNHPSLSHVRNCKLRQEL